MQVGPASFILTVLPKKLIGAICAIGDITPQHSFYLPDCTKAIPSYPSFLCFFIHWTSFETLTFLKDLRHFIRIYLKCELKRRPLWPLGATTAPLGAPFFSLHRPLIECKEVFLRFKVTQEVYLATSAPAQWSCRSPCL